MQKANAAETNAVPPRLKALRSQMAKAKLDAYVVSNNDPHQSEYVPTHWKCRNWLTGFTGSNGTAVVLGKEAGLWTDSRYFIQAAQELKGSGIALFRMGEPGVPTWQEWLVQQLPKGARVGCFGKVYSIQTLRELRQKLEAAGMELATDSDLVAPIWKEGRPPLPSAKIRAQHDRHAGASRKAKLAKIRGLMKEKKADWTLLSSLDDIAWLGNFRGGDIAFVPVALSFALVGQKQATLFIDPAKVPAALAKSLAADGFEIAPYETVVDSLRKLPKKSAVYLAPARVCGWLDDAIPAGVRRIEGRDLTAGLKAVKNEAEVANFRRHMVSDGVAMVKFLCWLDQAMASRETVTEISAAEKLTAFRALQDEACGDSFATIAGYAEHAAMCHYSATPESQHTLKRRGLFLVDSGGQYEGATTDITRTIALGPVQREAKQDYTLVLKGLIALSSAQFLQGCTGTHLDILARLPMWKLGINFKHGTGHGIGNCLSVHEGPHGISPAWNDVKLEPGIMATVEPGVYREDRHGIRIENVVVCIPGEETEFGKFLKFETLTLCPIDTKPILFSLFDYKERDWLNSYHEQVYKAISPHLTREEKAWLKKATAPI